VVGWFSDTCTTHWWPTKAHVPAVSCVPNSSGFPRRSSVCLSWQGPLLLSGQQHYHNFILHNLRGSLLAQSHTPPAAVARCVSHWSALIFTTSSFLYRTVCICLQDAKPPWIHNFPALSQGFYACGTRTLELNILLGTHLLGL